jgi:hypothetical protein
MTGFQWIWAQMTLISTEWIWEYGPFARLSAGSIFHVAREGLPECCFKGGNIQRDRLPRYQGLSIAAIQPFVIYTGHQYRRYHWMSLLF